MFKKTALFLKDGFPRRIGVRRLMVYRYRVGEGKGCVGVDGGVKKGGTRLGRPTHSLQSE